MPVKSANFNFLIDHDEELVRLAAAAEGTWRRNPRLCVAALRTLSEALVKQAAAYAGLYLQDMQTLGGITHRLRSEGLMDATVYGLFITVREEGNAASRVGLPGRPARVFKHGEPNRSSRNSR